jgi:hypothetical protein
MSFKFDLKWVFDDVNNLQRWDTENNMAMKTTMVRKILIGIYILLVLGFVAKAEAGENGQKVSESSVEVGPFSF